MSNNQETVMLQLLLSWNCEVHMLMEIHYSEW